MSSSSPVRKAKPRKSASFSGQPLVMEHIAEESEGQGDGRTAASASAGGGGGGADTSSSSRTNGLRTRPRPHRSVGGGGGAGGGEDLIRATQFFPPLNYLYKCENQTRPGDWFLSQQRKGGGGGGWDVVLPSCPPVSLASSSSRRTLGRRRSDDVSEGGGGGGRGGGSVAVASERTTEEEDEGAGSTVRRVPSSLFYFQYGLEEAEEEDGGPGFGGAVGGGGGGGRTRRRIPKSDIPTSRKFSAASNYSFYEDEDDDDEKEEEDEEDDEEENTEKSAILGLKEKTEERILSDGETTSELYQRTLQEIDATTKVFRLNDETYQQVKSLLEEEMDRGLRRDGNHLATVKMYPTYVRSLPSGTEIGRFLALDLGGTNFRVLLVDLRGNDPPEVRCKIYVIPMFVMTGSGVALFDHIANCMSEFLDEMGLKDELSAGESNALPLGFTFSFPCSQDGLCSARLVRWTKGFSCSGVERQDVVGLLKEAIARKDLNVECVAIINDNVGVLMSAAHTDNHCRVGVILGTGTNCCYVEQLHKVELWDGDRDDPQQVVINTEWGAFGDSGVLDFLRNPFDYQLDRVSPNPGQQLFEKMISGMYMGELVRLLICELIRKGLLFGGKGSEEFFQRDRFYTKYISEIESDDPLGPLTNTRLVIEELNINRYTRDDCRYVQHICWQVSQRAAFLAGTAVASVIERLDEDQVTVAVDGSLYRFHPHFKDLMSKKISQLIKPNTKFKLVLASDGSGKGAALVAAAAANGNRVTSSADQLTEVNDSAIR